jgi:anti-anti-sigma factor
MREKTRESTLTVEPEHVAGALLLHVSGEVDIANAEDLARAVERTSAAVVVLDLAGVGYLDSSGIRAIEGAFRRLRSEDRSLLIVSPPDTAAQWTFRVAGFDPELLLESVDVALASTGDPHG